MISPAAQGTAEKIKKTMSVEEKTRKGKAVAIRVKITGESKPKAVPFFAAHTEQIKPATGKSRY